jgi:predicted ribosomally synthesized peptide with nif11-like leader
MLKPGYVNIMSQQNALEFISKVQTDDSLRARVRSLGQDLEALRKLAARYGFEFSTQDFQNSIKAMSCETRVAAATSS